MKKLFKNILLFIIGFAALLITASCSNKNKVDDLELTIGSGEPVGLFNPTARILARIINSEYLNHGIHAEAISTSGSGENIRKIMTGDLDMALVNDIIAEMAYRGEDNFYKYSENTRIRSISSFFMDTIIFVVNDKSGINSFKDIKGKKISVSLAGNAAIGDIADSIFKYYNIKLNEFERFPYGLEKSLKALEDNKIDGFMYITSHLTPFIKSVSNSKIIKCKLISFDTGLIQYLKTKYPVLKPVVIPNSIYPNMTNKSDTNTLGSRALLLTLEEMDDNVVYEVTKEICRDFSAFKSVHPAFDKITPETMAANLILPVHPGALKYYKEAGLAKYIPKNLILPRHKD